MKHSGYFTRAMAAKDRRYARVFGKMGYETTDLVPEEPSNDDIADLRETYEKVVGKRPFHGWDATQLAEKIAAAKAKVS